MKIRVLQEDLNKALNFVSHFVNPRVQLPILGNILLSAKKNKLSISATNLENSCVINVGTKVDKAGNLAVPAKIITDVISNLSTGPVDLSSEKELLKVSTQSFTSTIAGMNPTDFPEIPSSIKKSSLKFPRQKLIDCLSQVTFAVSTDETRPILTGVLMILQKGEVDLVATDGFRLSKKNMKVNTKKVVHETRVILPKSILVELARMDSKDESIYFEYREKDSQAIFAIKNVVLASRVLEGEYPDFEKIIPKEFLIKTFVDKEELLRAVKLSSVFARESANMVKVVLEKDIVKLIAEGSGSGSQETKVDAKVEGLEKKGFEIAFNYRFLEDFLRTTKGKEIQMEFSKPDSSGVFRDTEDLKYIHLVMPVKIQS
jgi:DNA polymerase-3 subunit beta